MDTSFLKMDIFFVVTTTVVFVLGVLSSVLVYFLIKVVRDVSDITARVRDEAEDIVDDVRDIREDIKDGVASAKKYTKVVASASIVRGVSNLMSAFVEAQSEAAPHKKRAPGRGHKKAE